MTALNDVFFFSQHNLSSDDSWSPEKKTWVTLVIDWKSIVIMVITKEIGSSLLNNLALYFFKKSLNFASLAEQIIKPIRISWLEDGRFLQLHSIYSTNTRTIKEHMGSLHFCQNQTCFIQISQSFFAQTSRRSCCRPVVHINEAHYFGYLSSALDYHGRQTLVKHIKILTLWNGNDSTFECSSLIWTQHSETFQSTHSQR